MHTHDPGHAHNGGARELGEMDVRVRAPESVRTHANGRRPRPDAWMDPVTRGPRPAAPTPPTRSVGAAPASTPP